MRPSSASSTSAPPNCGLAATWLAAHGSLLAAGGLLVVSLWLVLSVGAVPRRSPAWRPKRPDRTSWRIPRPRRCTHRLIPSRRRPGRSWHPTPWRRSGESSSCGPDAAALAAEAGVRRPGRGSDGQNSISADGGFSMLNDDARPKLNPVRLSPAPSPASDDGIRKTAILLDSLDQSTADILFAQLPLELAARIPRPC